MEEKIEEKTEEKSKNIIICLSNPSESFQMAEKLRSENVGYQIINELEIYRLLYDLFWLFDKNDLKYGDLRNNIDVLKSDIKAAFENKYDYADIEPLEYILSKIESPEYLQANPLMKDKLFYEYNEFVNKTMINDLSPNGYRDYSDLEVMVPFIQQGKVNDIRRILNKGKGYINQLEKQGIPKNRIRLAYDGRVVLYQKYPFDLSDFYSKVLGTYGLEVDSNSAKLLYSAISYCYLNEYQKKYRNINIYPHTERKKESLEIKREAWCLQDFTSTIRQLFGDKFLVKFNQYEIELACDAAFQLSKFKILKALIDSAKNPSIIVLPPGFLNVELMFDKRYKENIEVMIERDTIYEENYEYVKDSIRKSNEKMKALVQYTTVIEK